MSIRTYAVYSRLGRHAELVPPQRDPANPAVISASPSVIGKILKRVQDDGMVRKSWSIVCIFILWKLIDVTTAILAPRYIEYLGFFSYPETMLKYGLPAFIRSLSNFDGIMYIRIALQGYSPIEEAYFPLYPMLIGFFTPLLADNPIIAGVIITNVAFLFAIVMLWQLGRLQRIDKRMRLWIIAFLLAYPTSYFFNVMYTESVFIVLLLCSLYCLYSRKYGIGILFGYLTGLTRVTGVLLAIPIGVFFLQQIQFRWPLNVRILFRKHVGVLLFMIAPILGLVSYAGYLGVTRGDPLAFFHAQEHFGANRSTRIILLPQVIYRYIKIFLTADKSFQYNVAILELTFLVFALGILAYDLKKLLEKGRPIDSFRLGLNLFSFANILVPTLTGTLTALPRYTLLSLSIFFVFAQIQLRWVKIALLISFMAIHVVMFAYFIQGYYLT